MKLSEAFAEARRRQRKTAPRRAQVKEAFDATRRLPGIRDASSEEIRASLREALATRGLHDFSDRRLDPMTRAIQTSRTSVLADYALTGVQKAREVVAWLKEHQIPTWLNPPERAVPLEPSSGVQGGLGRVDLEPRDHALLARLLAELPVPAHLPDEVDDLEPYFHCWLDLEEPLNPRSAVVVHAGKHRLGRLEEEAADRVRPELTRLARQRKALLAGATLHGSTPGTVEVRLMVIARLR